MREQIPPMRERGHQLFAQARHTVQHGPELAARNAEQARLAARDAGDNHGPAGKQIDVAGEVPRLVNCDDLMAVRRILNFDLAGFDDEQANIRVAGAKHNVAVGVFARSCQGSDQVDFRRRQSWKRGVRCLCHCMVL